MSRGDARIALGVGVVALAAHLPVVRGEFLNWDDVSYVLENPMFAGSVWENLARIFTTSFAANWHPLTWISHGVDRALFGANASAHHTVNLVLHALNAVVLFRALLALTGLRGRSAVVALLFAAHPLRTESVAWISERKDLLCGLFFLLAVLAHARYAAGPNLRRYAMVGVFALLALLAKQMAVTLPVVLLLLDGWPLRRLGKRSLLEKIPLLALSASASAAAILAQSGEGATVSLAAIPFPDRVVNAVVSTAGYLAKTLWPAGLSPFYPFPGIDGVEATSSVVVLGAAAGLLVISAGVLAARRAAPYLGVGWLWYLVMLLPVSGLIQVGSQAMADRYTYLPMIGPVCAGVWGVCELMKTRSGARRAPRLATAAAALLICGLALLSWRQAGFWRDSESLWSRAIAVEPTGAVAHGHLGEALVDQGRAEEGMAEYHRALQINPRYEPALFNLGLALSRQGQGDDALEAFREVLRIRPDLADAKYQIANRLFRRGEIDEALRLYREVVADEPTMAIARYDLAVILTQRGETEEAIEQYRAAIRAQPRYPQARMNLSMLLLARGDYEGARRAVGELLARDPGPQQAETAERLLREIQRRESAPPE